jgi:hypothetical protein
MYRSFTIIIRKSLASLVLAAAVLTAALGAGAVISDSPTHAAGDGFVWPNGAATVDGNH